jgi:hypothetical protein
LKAITLAKAALSSSATWSGPFVACHFGTFHRL